MKLTLDYLSVFFNRLASSDYRYQEALKITRQNSKGKMWLIGSYVYKNLARVLYGTGTAAKDFDFIVEDAKQEIILPNGWEMKTARFGSPKFVKADMQVDFVPINKIVHIIFYDMPRTIENFLKRTPFNIHSIAFDIETSKVIGEIGRKALEEKIVRINDIEMAHLYAKKYNINIDELLKKKADELGFGFEQN